MKRVAILLLIMFLWVLPIANTYAQINNTYNPSVQVENSGGSFQGLKFQGVSASVLDCTDITQRAAVEISGFINTIKGTIKNKLPELVGTTNSVSVNDQNTQNQVNLVKAQQKSINDVNYCLQSIGWAVAKNMLAQVVNQTLGWATKGGIYGLPLFIQNPNQYLQNLTNEELNKFLQDQNDHPIFAQSVQSIVMLSHTGVNDGRLGRTLNSNKATTAYNNFQQDFTSGGWGSFMNMNYNPVGAVFNASNSISNNINTAQQNQNIERMSGSGFTDVKTCKKWQVAPLKIDSSTGKPSPYTFAKEPTCSEWETVTPGYIVAQQVANATLSTQRQLEIATNYNQVLGAYFDQLLTNLFTKGLVGASTGRGTIQTRFDDNSYLGDLFGGGAGGLFGYSSTGGSTFVGEFDISKPQHTRSILKTQMDYLNAAKDSYIAMKHIVPVLGALDYCIPGPNPTWQSGLGDNYQNVFSSLSNKADPTKFNRVASDISSVFHVLDGVPIVGRVLTGIVDGILKIFGSDKADYYFFSQPTLYDKVTDDYNDLVTPIVLKYENRSESPDIDIVAQELDNGYGALRAYLNALYTQENLIKVFSDAQKTTATPFDAGKISDMIEKTSKLIGYNKAVTEIEPEYLDSIEKTQAVVEELTDINNQVENIVKIAKARYIAENKAKNTPIKESCLNKQYIINTTPVVGAEREETDVVDEMLLQSLRSKKYFYNKFMLSE